MVCPHPAESSARLVHGHSRPLLLSVVVSLLFVWSSVSSAFGAAAYDLVAATSGTVQAPAGGSGALTVTWRNKGPGTAPGAALAVTPPIGATLGALPAGWQRSGNSAVRAVSALASGGSGTASFAVVVNKNAVPGGLLVGGFFEVSGAGGVDRAPANNEASFRIKVRDGKATPSPSVKPTPTVTPTVKPTPKPSAKPTAKPTVKPKPAVTQQVTPKARSTSKRPSPKVSTHLAVAPPPSGGATNGAVAASGVIEVTDGSGDGGSSALVPMIGALTCFTAAGLGVVILRRRRLDARADAAELHSMRSRQLSP